MFNLKQSIAVIILCGVLSLGCISNPVKDVLSVPGVKESLVKTLDSANKTFGAGVEIHDPAIEVFVGTAIIVKLNGVDGELELDGASGPSSPQDGQ